MRIPTLYLRPLFAVTKNVSPIAGPPPLSYSFGQDILGGSNTAACQTLRWVAAHGVYNHISYLPANHFWPVKSAESAIYLVLTLALAIFTYWLVMTRDA